MGSILCAHLDEIWVEAVVLQVENQNIVVLQSLPLPLSWEAAVGAGNGAGGKSKCLLTLLGTISVLHLIASV